jgi:hypothetical protein
MDSALDALPSGAEHRSELKELCHFIQTGVRKAEPNLPLVQASLYYLKREKELKSLVIQLRNIIHSGTTDKNNICPRTQKWGHN